MKLNFKVTLIGIIILLFSNSTYSAKITSNGTGGGNWGNGASWAGGVSPGCGDTVCIVGGDQINVAANQDYSGCGSAMFVIVDSLGILHFPTNGRRLTLPCNSGVILNNGSLLIATGSGGGSSTYLDICGIKVWQKSHGNILGPFIFGTPLPIKLLSFEANLNEDKVDLTWVTSSEVNNDYFTVEKSQDGKEWQEVIKVNGAGNSTQQISYFDSDYTPYMGQSYYRLKQTDYNGEFTYSNTVPVHYREEVLGTLTLFPNPIKLGDELTISFNDIEEEEVLVVLRDITGKEYYSKLYLEIEKGKLIGIPIEKAIPSGIYLVTATSENRVYNKKLIVR